MIRFYCIVPLLLITLFAANAAAISDSMVVEDYYSQMGQPISRGELEKFLFNQNSSSFLSDRSKGCRIAAFAIGAPLWCITTGISIWQVMQFVDAFKKQEPPIPSVNKFALPLMIGGEITGFIQSRLNNRSDYLLYKAAVAYNNSIAQRLDVHPPLNHRIQESRPGWYTQDRVFMPPNVLYSVLKENGTSYTPANSWMSCKTIGDQSFAFGSLSLMYGIVGFLTELYFKKLNDDPNQPYIGHVNISQRNTCLGIGIGLIGFGFMMSKIASDLKELAIQKYNDALTDSSYQYQLRRLSTQGIIEHATSPATTTQEQSIQQPAQQTPQPPTPPPVQQLQQPPQKDELSNDPTHEIH